MSNDLNDALMQDVERYVRMIIPTVKRVGPELECGDINGNKGASFKVNINTGKWGDFATDMKGNQIVGLFITYHQHNNSGVSTADAMKWIEKEILGMMGSSSGVNILRNTKTQNTSKVIKAAPDFLYHTPPVGANPLLNHFKHGAPSQTWKYSDFDGSLIGFVCRYDHDDGKEYVPWSYGQKLKHGDKYTATGWRMKQQQAPRKMYNLSKINKDCKSLIICEGEKTADYIAQFSKNVTTWAGGSKAHIKSDFSWIQNKKIVLCPDNDKAGFEAMTRIAEKLKSQGCNVKFFLPSENSPHNWDCADFDGDGLLKEIKSNLVDTLPDRWIIVDGKEVLKTNHADMIIPHDLEANEILKKNDLDEDIPPTAPSKPFEVLGSDNDKIYLLNHKSKRIFAMTTSELNEKSLYRVAPKYWWDANYAHELGKKPDMLQAYDDIIQEAYKKPFFDGDKIRGRGVWIDNNNIIMNSGDAVYENGVRDDLGSYKTKNHYIASKPFDFADSDMADNNDLDEISNVFEYISMKGGYVGKQMLLGWCVSAQICGALNWRPHIWLTGQSGSGKSWIMEHVIQNIIASRAIYPEAGTSEAGIRQALSSDAMAVVYEEAESNSPAQAAKIQSVIELARTASSSSKRGAIYKGGSGGSAVQNFKVRSSFCFLGIQPALQQKADLSRITMLEIVKDNDNERYAKLTSAAQKLTPELCDRFFMWMIKHINFFIENMKSFTAVLAKELGGGQRNGDQIGTLLACAWTIINKGKTATESDIIAYCHKMDWSTFDHINDDPDDAEMLQKYIMQQQIKVETKSGSVKTRKISTVIAHAFGVGGSDDVIYQNEARIALEVHGIYVKQNYKGGDCYGIENNINIRKMLRDSAWGSGFMQTLRRHPDVINDGKMTKIRSTDSIKSCVMLKFIHDGDNGKLI